MVANQWKVVDIPNIDIERSQLGAKQFRRQAFSTPTTSLSDVLHF